MLFALERETAAAPAQEPLPIHVSETIKSIEAVMHRSTPAGAILTASAVATLAMILVVLGSSPAGEVGAGRAAGNFPAPPTADTLPDDVGNIATGLDLAELRRFDDALVRPCFSRSPERGRP
jgi:hypothetical protein